MILKMPSAQKRQRLDEPIEAIGNCGRNAVKMLAIYEDELRRIANEKIADAGWGDRLEVEELRRVGEKIYVVLNVVD